MFWHLLRVLFNITIRTYYRKIQTKDLSNINVENPVLIAMNHPNAFMDPIAFSMIPYPPRVRYLARGDAFKEGFVTFVLEAIGIVPIFRIQDAGKEGLKKNDETFKRVNQLLGRNKKIIVFAEGLCIQERRLRPLKKGPARMVFGAMEALNNPDLLVIPVGVNYSQPEKFRSFVYYHVGEAIRMKDYAEAYSQNPARTMNQFTQVLSEKMKELIVHVNDKENDQLIEQLQPVLKKQWIEEQGLDYMNLEHQQKYWEYIVSAINAFSESHPAEIAVLRKQVNAYSAELRKLGLRDHLIRRESEGKPAYSIAVIAGLIIGFPFYLVGKILNYVPYKLSELLTKKIVKNIEFYSSVNGVAGTFLFLFWYIIEVLVIWLVFHSWLCVGLYTAVKVLTGWFALHYSPFRRKTLGKMRLKLLKQRNQNAVQSLIDQRKSIINNIKNMS